MKQNSTRYRVEKFWSGKSFDPEAHPKLFDNLDSALSEAESGWVSGKFQMINIVDTSIPYAGHYLDLLWLRQRPDAYGTKTVSGNTHGVQIPDFPSNLTLWLGSIVPVNAWAANVAGGPTLAEGDLVAPETMMAIVQRILDSGHLLGYALVNSGTLNFDGFSIIDECAHFTFS